MPNHRMDTHLYKPFQFITPWLSFVPPPLPTLLPRRSWLPTPPSTLSTYRSALSTLENSARQFPTMPATQIIQTHLLDFIRKTKSASTIKSCLAAVSLLAKTQILEIELPKNIWRLHITAAKFTRPRTRPWASPCWFEFLRERCDTPEKWWVLGCTICAFAFGLRVGKQQPSQRHRLVKTLKRSHFTPSKDLFKVKPHDTSPHTLKIGAHLSVVSAKTQKKHHWSDHLGQCGQTWFPKQHWKMHNSTVGGDAQHAPYFKRRYPSSTSSLGVGGNTPQWPEGILETSKIIQPSSHAHAPCHPPQTQPTQLNPSQQHSTLFGHSTFEQTECPQKLLDLPHLPISSPPPPIVENADVPDDFLPLEHLSKKLTKSLPGHPSEQAIARNFAHLFLRMHIRLRNEDIHTFILFLHQLLSLDWVLIWLRRYYPDIVPRGAVTSKIIQKGLGVRGHLPIPLHIWNSIVTHKQIQQMQNASFAEAHKPVNPHVSLMIKTLITESFLEPSGSTPNCTLFVIPKTTEKVSLIADLRFINTFSPDPMPTFQLPKLKDIFRFISENAAGSLWATTLDLTNFFWSLELPPRSKTIIPSTGWSIYHTAFWMESLPNFGPKDTRIFGN